MNTALSLVEGFKLDRVELFNALDIFIRLADEMSHERLLALFYAAIRISVFYRRRRDVLSLQRESVRKNIDRLSDILDAESHIMSALGCHVWRSSHNLLEVTLAVLQTITQRCFQLNVKQAVTDLTGDVCTVMHAWPGLSSYTIWYGNNIALGFHILREAAVLIVTSSIQIVTQCSETKQVAGLVHKNLPPPYSIDITWLARESHSITLLLLNSL
jgi:hypothetical protein